MGKSGASGIGSIAVAIGGVLALGGRMCSKVDDVARIGKFGNNIDEFADISRLGKNSDEYADLFKYGDEAAYGKYADDPKYGRYGEYGSSGRAHSGGKNGIDQINSLYDHVLAIKGSHIDDAREITYLRNTNANFNQRIDALYDNAMYKSKPDVLQTKIEELVTEFRTDIVLEYGVKAAKITRKTLKLINHFSQDMNNNLEKDIDLSEAKTYTIDGHMITIPAGYREINSFKINGIRNIWIDSSRTITLYEFGWSNEDLNKFWKQIKLGTRMRHSWTPNAHNAVEFYEQTGDYELYIGDNLYFGTTKMIDSKNKRYILEVQSDDQEYILDNGQKYLGKIWSK
jgi:hypothetical protein